MTQLARRPSVLAPLLALTVALGTLAWGLRSTSGWVIQQAIFGNLDVGSSLELRALVSILAIAIMEGVLAATLMLGRWQPSSLHVLGLLLIAVGVFLAQLALTGPFWALALLGAWLVWEAFSMRSEG